MQRKSMTTEAVVSSVKHLYTRDQTYSKKQKGNAKEFDYTTITDRLRMSHLSDNSHPIGVVDLRIIGPIFPLLATFVH